MKIYSSTLAPNVHVAFTTTAEGNLAGHVGDDPLNVTKNRAALEQQLGLENSPIAFMNQVHSNIVVDAVAPGEGEAPTADGLLSNDARQPLAVMVADCVPLAFVGVRGEGEDPITAVAHAGRRGLLDGVIENTLSAMRDSGATQIEAWIGPAICGRCYEVPADMQSSSEHSRPGISSTTTWGTPALDLPKIAAEVVRKAGGVVHETHECTLENEEYFSYRRDPQTGRLAGIVWTASEGTK